MIRGVLFDMDGVLVDSEHFICGAAVEMFREYGIPVTPEDFKPFTGMGENRYLGGVAEKYRVQVDIDRVKARTYSIYAELVSGNLTPLAGSSAFIEKCRNKGLRLALATSADRIKMEINLKEIGLPQDTFGSVITGLDVVHKKPAPEIYIKAAESLGLKPDECLVVEDAVSGVLAGKSAGSRCLAVLGSFSAEALEAAGADWIVNSLGNVPEEVFNW